MDIFILIKKAARILEYCEHWKSCQDGSYEQALHSCGYYELEEEIKRRQEENT